jgi:hypothetical protein
MTPPSYENYVFSLPSAFNSSHWEQNPEPQNPKPLTFTFKSAEGSSVVRKQQKRANTMPWNHGPISFYNLSESGHSSSSTYPDFRHGLHTPRTPSNAFAQGLDVDTNIELESGGDWRMDGYLPRLNNVHITVLNK